MYKLKGVEVANLIQTHICTIYLENLMNFYILKGCKQFLQHNFD